MKDRIVAHRGNAAEHRENTLDAIRSAIELGCKYIEFDVQISSDGVPHVLHDINLNRMVGKDLNAFDTSSAALSGYGIPRLQEATELLSAHPHVTAFVEVKTEGVTRFGREAVIRSVREVADPEQCVLISFDLDALPVARSAGYRIGAAILDPTFNGAADRCRSISPEFVLVDHLRVSRPMWNGAVWIAWEVGDMKVGRELLERGFALLETMQVRKLMSEATANA